MPNELILEDQDLESGAALPLAKSRPGSPTGPPLAHDSRSRALYKLEKRYRALIESLPQRVFFKDRDSVFVSVNAAFATDFGLRPEDLVGKSDRDFFPSDLAQKYCADDQRVMASRVPETIEEVNITGDKMRIVEVVKTPVLGDDGEVIGLIGLFTDITERKSAEASLRDLTAQLERSNRELQDFAYVASHDLQEPLRKISVFGDRVKSKYGQALSEEGQNYLDRMLKAAGRMQNLINDLLAFSRLKTKPRPFARVDLAQTAADVLSDLEARIEQMNARVEVDGLPAIEAEPLQMRQLLQNLIGNALKFRRPNEQPVVRVRGAIRKEEVPNAPRNTPPVEILELTVADNGIGFDEKYLDRIFNVFQRLHSRSEYEGTGMGLAIARRIAEHHRGEITARSKPGEGATFIVRLPVHQNQPQTRIVV